MMCAPDGVTTTTTHNHSVSDALTGAPAAGALYGSVDHTHNNNNRQQHIDAGRSIPPAPISVFVFENDDHTRRRSAATATTTAATVKTPGRSCWYDVRTPGSIPHSIWVATVIGIVCGLAATLYYTVLEYALDVMWKTLPMYLFMGGGELPDEASSEILSAGLPLFPTILWIPFVGFIMATGVGMTVRCIGEPGDLAYTVKCVHETAVIGLDHVTPMLLASQCSILAGGSLGPEAPLVAICAALAGAISRFITYLSSSEDSLEDNSAAATSAGRNILRKHTLMGMAGALAAFFGCPLGGSLFALEVCSRFGTEYFEHAIEAILAGEVCLAVFRFASGLPIQPIWNITETRLTNANSMLIGYGLVLGLLGAGIAYIFSLFHRQVVMRQFRHWNLLQDNTKAISRAWLGAVVVVTMGMMIPQTLFWGEFEFQTIATMAPVSTLPHVFPAMSLIGFEMHNMGTALIVGVAKLICISFTVAGGYRGGFIFPLFSAAAAFGRAVHCIAPFVPVQLCVLCLAASVNVAITRTALGSTLILAYLSGEPNAIAAILASSLVSLLATAYMPPFIATQVPRSDLEHSIHILSPDKAVMSDKMKRISLDESSEMDETMSLTPFSDVHKQMDDEDVVVDILRNEIV